MSDESVDGRSKPRVGCGFREGDIPGGQSWILPPPNAHQQLRQKRFRSSLHFITYLLGTGFARAGD